MIDRKRPNTRDKAIEINLDPAPYGTFAEIGAGQETVRWFFNVGGAAGTVAKTISAYDMTVSTAIYGESDRFVSRARLVSMLDHEYGLLVERLEAKRAEVSTFFAFANTVATRSFSRHQDGDGWIGIRFQDSPGSETSEVIVHVRLYDREASREQEALGVLGVNLIHGVFRYTETLDVLVSSLMDDLSRERVEIDLLRVSGPAFPGVDNRLLSLQLVELGFTDATMFTPEGDVIQAAEAVYNRSIVVERGSFRPVVKPAIEMLERVESELFDELGRSDQSMPLVIMEMTLSGDESGAKLEHGEFLELVGMVGALGKFAMVSKFTRYDELVGYLRRHTRHRIACAVGAPGVLALFDEAGFEALDGGILEGMGRLFKSGVSLHVYPFKAHSSDTLLDVSTLSVAPNLRHLYRHLVENGLIKPILELRMEPTDVLPSRVREMIQSGDRAWEEMVPERLVPLIRECRCAGLEEGEKARQAAENR